MLSDWLVQCMSCVTSSLPIMLLGLGGMMTQNLFKKKLLINKLFKNNMTPISRSRGHKILMI